jgi:hypothetical protein
MRVVVVVCVIALAAGCDSQPAAPTAPATAAVAAAAQPAAPAVADATRNAAATAKVPTGYSAKMRNGETVYCKKVTRTGSNFATETCMTAAEADELARRAVLERQEFRGNQAICGTGNCGGT